MTYATQEASLRGGAPFELYMFHRIGQCWYYTSADQPFTFNGNTYQPVVISRGEIQITDENEAASVEVSMDSALSIVQPFVAGAPPTPIWLTIFRGHRTESAPVLIFQGHVAATKVADRQAVFTCTAVQQVMDKSIPRQMYQRICNHVLYDPGCGVNKELFRVDGTLDAIGNLQVNSNAASTKPNGWFSAGFFQVQGTEIRGFITEHTTSVLKLLSMPPGLQVGQAISMYAGCDRRVETCVAKFNNLVNFLGFPHIPIQNPFDRMQ